MKEIVYATHHEPWMAGKGWRNARYFHAADPEATQVFVVDDFPRITAAYLAMGIPVIGIGPNGQGRAPVVLQPPSVNLSRKTRRRAKT